MTQRCCNWQATESTLSWCEPQRGFSMNVATKSRLIIRDSARIVEITSDDPSWDDGHVFAVEPRPETKDMPFPSVLLLSLLHRLILVTPLSAKSRPQGGFRRESVKLW